MPRISTPIIHLGIGEIAITWVCRASRPTLNQILTRTLLLSGPTLLLCFKSPSIDGNQILCLTVLKMLGFLSTVHSYLSKQINNNLRKDWSSQVWGGCCFWGGLFGFWVFFGCFRVFPFGKQVTPSANRFRSENWFRSGNWAKNQNILLGQLSPASQSFTLDSFCQYALSITLVSCHKFDLQRYQALLFISSTLYPSGPLGCHSHFASHYNNCNVLASGHLAPIIFRVMSFHFYYRITFSHRRTTTEISMIQVFLSAVYLDKWWVLESSHGK